MKATIRYAGLVSYNYTVWDESGIQVGGSFTSREAAEVFAVKMGYTL